MIRHTLSHCGQARPGYHEKAVVRNIHPVNTSISQVSRDHTISFFSRENRMPTKVASATMNAKGIEVEKPQAIRCGFM